MYELEIAIGAVGFIVLSALFWRYGKRKGKVLPPRGGTPKKGVEPLKKKAPQNKKSVRKKR